VADLFGASMDNMLILAFADLATVRFRMLTRFAVNQALVGTLAIALTATVTAGIVGGNSLRLGTVGWAPLFAAMGYLVGMRLLYVNRPEAPLRRRLRRDATSGSLP